MKFPFFKTLAVAGVLMVAWNCSDESTDASNQIENAINMVSSSTISQPPLSSAPVALSSSAVTVISTASQQSPTWVFSSGDIILTIVSNPDNSGTFVVNDANGLPFGYYDVQTGTIFDAAGSPVVSGLDLSTLPTLPTESASSSAEIALSSEVIVLSSSDAAPIETSSTIAPQPASSANIEQPQSSAEAKSSSSVQVSDSKVTVSGELTQTVAKNQSINKIVFNGVEKNPDGTRDWKIYYLNGKYDENAKTYTFTGTVPEHIGDGTYTETITIDGTKYSIVLNVKNGNDTQQKSSSSQQQQQVKSSSSQAKSSSSQAKSSSSQQQQQQSSTPSYKVKNGGRSGQGWGSRYWDCCMPHCAWKGNTGNPTKVCNAQMQTIGEEAGSVCSNGQGGVCDFQAPWAVNDKFAFAFAAVPAGLGGECGKCFLLTFDGKTHNGGAKANTDGLNGKQMIIMVSNIGGDVGSNQFDIMIPGGGVGMFNGCGTQLGINSTGAQYGGYITDCKSDPSCVKQKCSAFSKYPKLQAGCEFSADWMGGANNPTFKFEELESCPSEISSKW